MSDDTPYFQITKTRSVSDLVTVKVNIGHLEVIKRSHIKTFSFTLCQILLQIY